MTEWIPRSLAGLAAALVATALVAARPEAAVANHVACGDTITQDTTLDSGLVDCPGDGIVIGADDVTLDLGGHTIDGTGDGTGAGTDDSAGIDNGAGHDGVTIANGRVQGFWDGIRHVGATDGSVKRITASGNIAGIMLHHSERNVIAGNVTSGGGAGFGLSLREADLNVIADNTVTSVSGGIYLSGSSGNLIEGNRLSRAGTGIFISGDSNVVRSNAITEHDIYGIFVRGPKHVVELNSISGSGTFPHVETYGIHASSIDDTRIARNSVSQVENGIFCIGSQAGSVQAGSVIARNDVQGVRRGIYSLSCHGARIAHNTVRDGAGLIVALSTDVHVEHNRSLGIRGITLSDVNDSRVERNVVLNAGEEGIDVRGSRNQIVRNRVVNSGYRGFMLVGDGNVIAGNIVRSSGLDGIQAGGSAHRIERNLVAGSGRVGILAWGSVDLVRANSVRDNGEDGIVAGGGLIEGNRASGNADDGIEVDDPGATLTRNTANHNGDLGIEAVAGVTDGGWNRASGNQNPLQCLNVVCR